MVIIKARVSKGGPGQRLIYIPKIYVPDFPAGSLVSVGNIDELKIVRLNKDSG